MTTVHASGDATVTELASSIRGSLVRPGEPDYELARRTWNHAIDRHPALVVRPTGVADVVRTVQFARSEGLPVAVRGGGHSIAGFSTCDDGLVLDLSGMRAVDVDPARGRATAQGGATWGDFDHETQAYGLACTGGLISTTGIGGLTLGGGIGHLLRKHGLACDNLTGAEVVTADGTLARTADDPELLWALRGGGGNFGVVTTMEYALHPVGPTVFGGLVFYAGDDAAQVVTGWRDAVEDAPDELSTVIVLTTAPPAPFLPAQVHGTKVVVMLGCWAGEPVVGEEAMQPLRTLATPLVDLSGPIPYVALQQLLDPLWGPGAANYFTSTFLDRLPDEAVAEFAQFHRSSAGLPASLRAAHPPRRRRARPGAGGRHGVQSARRGLPRQLHRPDTVDGRVHPDRRMGPGGPRCPRRIRHGARLRQLHRRRRTGPGPGVLPPGHLRPARRRQGPARPRQRLPVQPEHPTRDRLRARGQDHDNDNRADLRGAGPAAGGVHVQRAVPVLGGEV